MSLPETPPDPSGLALSLESSFFGFYAHAGFAAGLLEGGIRPQFFSGSSAGSMISVFLAAGFSTQEIRDIIFSRKFKWAFWELKGLARGFAMTLYWPGVAGLTSFRHAEKYFSNLLKDRAPNLEDCRDGEVSIPVANLNLLRTEILTRGSSSAAILASCAVWQATISHGTAILRKAVLDQIGLYDENPFAADAFWSAKLALYAETGAAVRVANVPEYLTLIRIHSASQTQTLPVFDPRNRRVRYRHYCECGLQRIREKQRKQPQLDVAAELRNCNCSDFLLRFKAKILQWESETLPTRFLNDLLGGAVGAFQSQSHVTCATILNGLEVIQRDIARRVMGFDLFRAMALHASGLPDRGWIHAQREIENHDSSVARRFLQDSREQGASMVVHRWYAEHASHLELRLAEADPARIGAPV